MKAPHKILLLIWVIFLITISACSTTDTPVAEPALPVTELPSAPGATDTVQAEEPTPTSSPEAEPASTPVSVPVFGIEMIRFGPAAALELVQNSGVHWLRRNALFWSDVEAVEGQRDWSQVSNLEEELKQAAERGFEVILIVRSTPAWAQQIPGVFCGPVKEDKLPAFADFMGELVARYSAPPYNVKYYEFGNEPDVDSDLVSPDNIFGCWGDEDDPYYGGGYYAEMLKAVYPAVKGADPAAQVVVGGLLMFCDPVNPPEDASGNKADCKSSRFLEGILEAGGGDYFDHVSFHAYDYFAKDFGQYVNEYWHSTWNTTGPVLIAKTRYLRDLLSSYGYPEKGLLNSETAVVCTFSDAECQTPQFSSTKAYYAAETYAAAMAEGLLANIWYSFNGWRFSGWVDQNMNTFPVYEATKTSVQMLRDAQYQREITEFPGIKGYEFDRGGVRLWLVWSLDGQDHAIQLPSTPAAMYDVFGDPLPAQTGVIITIQPYYIEWAP